jgi:hypothetical protein
MTVRQHGPSEAEKILPLISCQDLYGTTGFLVVY